MYITTIADSYVQINYSLSLLLMYISLENSEKDYSLGIYALKTQCNIYTSLRDFRPSYYHIVFTLYIYAVLEKN